MTSEERYIRKRLREARRQAREFYYCRKYPIQENKIVFTTIEGTTGFSCNPKYIALELLRRNLGLDLIWLVDDMTKKFPKGIRKVKNTLKNRAYDQGSSICRRGTRIYRRSPSDFSEANRFRRSLT